MEGEKLYNVQFTRPINHIGRDAPEAVLHSSGMWVIVTVAKTGLVRMVPIDLIVSADLVEMSKDADRTIPKGPTESPAARKQKAASSGTSAAK